MPLFKIVRERYLSFLMVLVKTRKMLIETWKWDWDTLGLVFSWELGGAEK